MKGAEAVFASTKPKVVINLKVGIARDFPVHFPNHLSSNPCLEKGPTFFVYDGSMPASNELVEYFSDFAVSCSIPFQLRRRQSITVMMDAVCRGAGWELSSSTWASPLAMCTHTTESSIDPILTKW